jgi:predicted aspartyl protease
MKLPVRILVAASSVAMARRPMKTTQLLCLAWLLASLHPLLAAAATSEAVPFSTHVGDPVSIPAEIADHVIFVNVTVNGHGPFRVMVDTGCSVTLVSPELAEAVGATDSNPEEDLVVAQNALGNPTDVQRVILGSVDLGGVHFEGVLAAVSDTFDELSTIHGRRVDGALGFPLFHDLFLGLDFPNHRVLLGNQWPANVPAIRAGLSVVEHAATPFVQVQVQGRPVDVMIDTGANHGLHLTPDLASAFQWKVEPRVGPLVAAVGEMGREWIGRLAGSLLLGGTEQVEPTAVISAGPPSIGLRSLESFCVIFHQSESMVWFCGPGTAPLEPTAERSIGLSLYSDPGGWRVAGVIPGSPADDAHVSAGALVTQVQGQPAMNWTRDQMQQWIESHANVALVVASDAGERALTLRVWDLVP